MFQSRSQRSARRKRSIRQRRAVWRFRFWLADRMLALVARLAWIVLRVAVVIWVVLALLAAHPAPQARTGRIPAPLAQVAQALLGSLAGR